MFDLTVVSEDASIQRIEPTLITIFTVAPGKVLYDEDKGGAQPIATANNWQLELNLPGPTDHISFGFTLAGNWSLHSL